MADLRYARHRWQDDIERQVQAQPVGANMNDVKQILCIKWGTMYDPEYVNCLYGMISRNLSYPFRLFCMTDNTEGIRSEVECLPLPQLGFEVPPGAPGKWPKQALWRRDLFGLQGVALFLDLDSVIVDSIDCYFEYGDREDVITARNWVKPWLRGAQTSVFRFPIGAHPYMLENLQKDPDLCVKYQFEQNYVTHHINGGIKFWPGAWTRHFRRHCMGQWPMRYLRPPRLPRGSRIVTFPGSPKPPDAIEGRWSANDVHRTPAEQLRWAFSLPTRKQRSKAVRRYLRPSAWVAEHWKP